jgi:hypothetical protein
MATSQWVERLMNMIFSMTVVNLLSRLTFEIHHEKGNQAVNAFRKLYVTKSVFLMDLGLLSAAYLDIIFPVHQVLSGLARRG